jgi:hypothetical protein
MASKEAFCLLKIAQSRVMDTSCMPLAINCTEVNIARSNDQLCNTASVEADI